MPEFKELTAEIFPNVDAAKSQGLFATWAKAGPLDAFKGNQVGVVWKKIGERCLTGLPGIVEVSAEYARLFAAAPDLLKACNYWDHSFTDGEEFTEEQFLKWVNEGRRLAREVIAKATGQ